MPYNKELQAGDTFKNSYQIESKINQGGFATVYRARVLSGGSPREVALKVLLPTASVEDVGKFVNEALLLQHTLHHPHIIKVEGIDIDPNVDIRYIVLPYIAGGSLDYVLARQGAQTPQKTVDIVSQTGEALQYVHNQGYLHLDVKPDNLLLEGSKILLTDFGIAIPIHHPPLKEAEGTEQYAPVEQFQRMPIEASDQFALAVTAYELLTQKFPYETRLDKLTKNPRPMSEVVPQYTAMFAELERVIKVALQKEPDNRYPTIEAFYKELQAAYNDVLTGKYRDPGSVHQNLKPGAQGGLGFQTILDQLSKQYPPTPSSAAGQGSQGGINSPRAGAHLPGHQPLIPNSNTQQNSNTQTPQWPTPPPLNIPNNPNINRQPNPVTQSVQRGFGRRKLLIGLAGAALLGYLGYEELKGGIKIGNSSKPQASPQSESQTTASPQNTPEPTATPEQQATPENNYSGILYKADWSKGLNGWTGSPDWNISNGNLVNDGTNQLNWSSPMPTITAPFELNTSVFTITSTIEVENEGEDPGFGFFLLYKNNGYMIGLTDLASNGSGYDQNNMVSFQISDPTQWNSPYEIVPFNPSGKHTYSFGVEGNYISVAIDGKPVMSVTGAVTLDGGVQVGMWDKNTQLSVSNFVVSAGDTIVQ